MEVTTSDERSLETEWVQKIKEKTGVRVEGGCFLEKPARRAISSAPKERDVAWSRVQQGKRHRVSRIDKGEDIFGFHSL